MLPPPSMPVVISRSALGRRVVVRFRRVGAALALAPDQPLSDALGELVGYDDDELTVQTRGGPVRIPIADVVLAKLVAADRAHILALEAVAARNWPAREQVELDGWLLRANDGWTSRANSVLPLGTPRRPVSAMIDDAASFYAQRQLPLQVQIALPVRGLLDAELAKRCWLVASPSLVMSKSLRATPTATERLATELPPGFSLVHEDSPGPRWQSGYHARDGQLSEAALALLSRPDLVTFLSARAVQSADSSDQALAIARATVEDGWVGLSALEVAPSARRQGLATALISELERWGVQHGARRAYLQIEAGNEAALALYTRLGYFEHHRYHYRVAPADGNGTVG